MSPSATTLPLVPRVHQVDRAVMLEAAAFIVTSAIGRSSKTRPSARTRPSAELEERLSKQFEPVRVAMDSAAGSIVLAVPGTAVPREIHFSLDWSAVRSPRTERSGERVELGLRPHLVRLPVREAQG